MCINAAEALKRNKLVDAILSGEQNIFDEIKKMKGNTSTESTRIDGLTDHNEIADHLKSQYEALYRIF